MLNHILQSSKLVMKPEGSLNKLAVSTAALHDLDPAKSLGMSTGYQLMSRQAMIDLLGSYRHPNQQSLRQFLNEFAKENPADRQILEVMACRFATVVNTACNNPLWQCGNDYQQRLSNHWQHSETLVISGGLTSGEFGRCLAESAEKITMRTILASPWGSHTALYGLAQNISQSAPLLTLDFGGTAVKVGVATRHGGRFNLFTELDTNSFKNQGQITDEGFLAILEKVSSLIREPLPVAISIACYLNKGHPFDYKSGVYHELGKQQDNLGETINKLWLPSVGLGALRLFEHDSTAAALAFNFQSPAMMITLGTGLGSAPCPISFAEKSQ